MKESFSIFFIASAIVFAGYSQSVENTVSCVQLDLLEKVFTEESYFVENPETAAVAKGETATFQFVVRSIYPIQGLKIEAGNLVNGNRQIVATLKAFVGYIRAGVHGKIPLSKDAILPVSDNYPDCLTEIETMDVPSMHNQPVWVSYAVPHDAATGDYSATLVFTGKIDGKPFRISRQVNAKIYPVTLPEQSLWISNWWTEAGLKRMNGGNSVEPNSSRYWELYTAMARLTRDHGQNEYHIQPFGSIFPLIDWTVDSAGTQFSFDFTNFDKMVEFFIREGGLKRIEGYPVARRIYPTNANSPFGIYIPTVGATRSIDDPLARQYLSQYLSALNSHLETKGWKSIYMLHITDEPNDVSASSYNSIANFVKTIAPDIPVIDATLSANIHVDIPVPLLSLYHNNYALYQERQKAGDEVWFYTCNGPQGNYANRFLELPLVQTRYLHWINYRYGATGYLHWGFNSWHETGNNIPAGDAWIVYPAEGKLYGSIRLAAMRDGIADYELLKLLEKKSPDKAKQLAAGIILGFDSYNSNISTFRQTRLKLLESLSE